MTLPRKDAVATSLTGLAVLAFLATHEAWNVPQIGHSHRWAAAVIMVLGIGPCSAGANRVNSALFGMLGGTAFVLGVLALITGSLTPLSLLVADRSPLEKSSTRCRRRLRVAAGTHKRRSHR